MAGSWQTLDRYGRHVRQARLSIPRGAPARKLAFVMEESLRLASLPGENEGRAYYFRRLRLTGLPVDGDRRTWLEKFQRMLLESAALAVHGTHPRAQQSPAVYFQGEAEALEILLHRSIARQPAEEWFWPMIAAAADEPSASTSWAIPASPAAGPGLGALIASGRGSPGAGAAAIPQLIERLRECEASWVAVAVALFSRPQFDAVRLLGAISPAAARRWLAELDTASGPERQRMVSLSFAAQPAITRALRAFGGRRDEPDARLVWLIAMAVLVESPGELALGTAVWHARRMLARMAPSVEKAEVAEPRVEIAVEAAPAPSGKEAPAPALQDGPPLAPSGDQAPAPSARQANRPIPLPAAAADEKDVAEAPPVVWQSRGERTNAAGLFFLLHVLRRLGIEKAQSDAPHLGAHVFYRLAMQAGVASEDPVRAWLESIVGGETKPTAEVRVWSIGVHRFIRRLPAEPALSVRNIIVREGVFSVNRTELDVSLPLDAADIRIRMAGLDLDPGWLPWFGRVVRFHYLYRGEFRA